ncbi:hypothetical protein N8Z70_00280 [Candidatus Puniceispirillum sp.]|nr:hypothetical protein [Alphaproteobacteria bacterium]MDC1293464.1 hypothetical protein [Candidatus Puniceispirillum sp.]
MNKMSHNQLSLFGGRVSDDTLEEVARFLRTVKNIGKAVSINVVSDAYTSAVSDVTVWIASVSCDFDPFALAVLMRNATTGRKRQQQIDWAQVT